jgi:hypothetical protein
MRIQNSVDRNQNIDGGGKREARRQNIGGEFKFFAAVKKKITAWVKNLRSSQLDMAPD